MRTMADVHQSPALHGVMAEFADATELVRAAKAAYAEGYRQMDAYTPVPVHGLAEALGHDDRRVQKFTFTGGVLGFVGGFALAYWTSVIDYPLNIGGRPLNSWVSFSIPTYETTILLAALATAGSMLAFNGLPQHYHPVFNVEAFRKTASSTGFFLCLEATDPRFDLARARAFLEGLHPKAINEVNP
jgi:Protein of unknown function (DUF3341)